MALTKAENHMAFTISRTKAEGHMASTKADNYMALAIGRCPYGPHDRQMSIWPSRSAEGHMALAIGRALTIGRRPYGPHESIRPCGPHESSLAICPSQISYHARLPCSAIADDPMLGCDALRTSYHARLLYDLHEGKGPDGPLPIVRAIWLSADREGHMAL